MFSIIISNLIIKSGQFLKKKFKFISRTFWVFQNNCAHFVPACAFILYICMTCSNDRDIFFCLSVPIKKIIITGKVMSIRWCCSAVRTKCAPELHRIINYVVVKFFFIRAMCVDSSERIILIHVKVRRMHAQVDWIARF